MSTARKFFAPVWIVSFVVAGIWLEVDRRDVASLVCFLVAIWGPWLAATTVETGVADEDDDDPLRRLR